MDELRANRIFLAVARRSGFAAAARELSLTPTAVTRSVAALEQHLGVQLLVRSTRQVSLTSAGATYAARIEKLIDGFDTVAREVRSAHAPDQGRLRISAPMSFGSLVLPAVLADFRKAYPKVELGVALSDAFVDILSGDYDLAIRVTDGVEGTTTIWRKLCLVTRTLVTKPETLETRITDPDKLAPDSRLAYSPAGTRETWVLKRGGEKRTLEAGAGLSSNNGAFLAVLVEDAGGVALLPNFIVRQSLQSGRLVTAFPDWQATDLWLSLYYPPYKEFPPLVATFSDFFEHHITHVRPISDVVS